MSVSDTKWSSTLVALLVFVGLVVAGCGDSSESGLPEDCVKLEKVDIPAGKGVVALVVDNSASAVAGELPPRIVTELKEAQGRGDSLVLVAVDGAGKPPAVVRKIALEPNPGVDSATADNARPIVLDCVARWARAEDMRPTAPGSAVLDAITVAARQKPSKLLVVSDGVNTVSPFDLNELGFDTRPDSLASALSTSGVIAPELENQEIVWTGLGETAQALPQPARTNLAEIWKVLLGKKKVVVEFDQGMGKRGSTPDGLPADSLIVPEVKKLALSCGTRRSIPSALLFGPDSAVLLQGAAELLTKIADEMAAQPDLAARIEGHTADIGDDEGKQRLSEDRAKAVAAALTGMGIEATRLDTAGFGSRRPQNPQAPTAATNRRVEITVGTKGCGR